ncbi:MAG: hypothetical protein GY800_00510 [Planctomycetes bacterium]|nr:hypothetical protein [Planctomycetota bacterium]
MPETGGWGKACYIKDPLGRVQKHFLVLMATIIVAAGSSGCFTINVKMVPPESQALASGTDGGQGGGSGSGGTFMSTVTGFITNVLVALQEKRQREYIGRATGYLQVVWDQNSVIFKDIARLKADEIDLPAFEGAIMEARKKAENEWNFTYLQRGEPSVPYGFFEYAEHVVALHDRWNGIADRMLESGDIEDIESENSALLDLQEEIRFGIYNLSKKLGEISGVAGIDSDDPGAAE